MSELDVGGRPRHLRADSQHAAYRQVRAATRECKPKVCSQGMSNDEHLRLASNEAGKLRSQPVDAVVSQTVRATMTAEIRRYPPAHSSSCQHLLYAGPDSRRGAQAMQQKDSPRTGAAFFVPEHPGPLLKRAGELCASCVGPRRDPGPGRFRVTALSLLATLALLNGVTRAAAPRPWESRLQGDAIVLLGEVHDNPVQQHLRLEILARALAKGWRPAIAMEQFDREHQADIEAARKERPRDANYLIEKAAPTHGKPGTGWNWDYYRPYVELALEHQLPLLAANLSRNDAERIVEHGYAAVFEPDTVHLLGLDREPASRLVAQEKEIDIGHCHTMPRELLPAMARAQLARDALMASIIRMHSAHGFVLLAGDGHVRRDIGVPAWLGPPLLSHLFTVGFLERGESATAHARFDAVLITEPAARPDPCATLRKPRS
jgi:uncharacterized iron-regulated protein